MPTAQECTGEDNQNQECAGEDKGAYASSLATGPGPSSTGSNGAGSNADVLANKMPPNEDPIVLSTDAPTIPFFLKPLFGPRFHPTRARIAKPDKPDEIYDWNSRAHRKMRYPTAVHDGPSPHPGTHWWHRVRLLSWEPRNASWWYAYCNEISNALWIISGVFQTWLSLSPNIDAANRRMMWTGMVGDLLCIISSYFGVLDSANHSDSEVVFPPTEGEPEPSRELKRRPAVYGAHSSPLGDEHTGYMRPFHQQEENVHKSETDWLERRTGSIINSGYPVVVDTATGNVISDSKVFDDESEIGRVFDIIHRKKCFRVQLLSVGDLSMSTLFAGGVGRSPAEDGEPPRYPANLLYKGAGNDKSKQNYDFRLFPRGKGTTNHMSVVMAYIQLGASIIYIIPDTAWYPIAYSSSPPSIPWQNFLLAWLQVIAALGFIIFGHFTMAEAAGSWCKPKWDDIGYLMGFFNAIGGYNYLVCAIATMPSITNADNFSYNAYVWAMSFTVVTGSAFFFIGGLLQIIEFASRHPIVLKKSKQS